MKKVFTFLLLYLISISIFSQEVVVQLDKNYGVSGSFDGAHNALQHPDGGYLIYGTSAGFSTDTTFDFYLVKTDEFGEEEWSKTFDTEDNSIIEVYTPTTFTLPNTARNNQLTMFNYGDQILLTDDNHILISGSSTYFGSGENKRSLPFIAKLDLDGNVVWQKLYQGQFEIIEQGSITELNDGYLLTNLSTRGGTSASWIKIDFNGNFVWENIIDSIPYTGSISAAPSVSLELDSGNIGTVVYDLNVGTRTVILELDPLTGGIVSTKKIRDDDHNLWVHDFVKINGGYLLIGTGATSYNGTIVSKIDNNFNLIWTKTYSDIPELSTSRGYDGVELNDGTYSIVGYNSNSKLFLLNVKNDNGAVNYFETFNDQYNIGYSIDLANDGSMLIGLSYYAGEGIGLPSEDMGFIKVKDIGNVAYVSGKAFFDDNENCAFDEDDYVFANALLLAENENGEIYQTRTDNNGNYNLVLSPSAYELSIINSINENQYFDFNENCNGDSITISLAKGQKLTDINYSFATPSSPPNGSECRVQIASVSSVGETGCVQDDGTIASYVTPCPGEQFKYCVSYKNLGRTIPAIGNAMFDVSFPPFVPGTVSVVTSSNGNVIVDEQVNQPDINIIYNNAIPVGGDIEICITATIAGPSNPTDDSYDFQITAASNFGIDCAIVESDPIIGSCSCDPNDMQVFPVGCGESGNVDKDETLTYTVRFENIGPGRARDVIITNPIDSDLDTSSIKLLNASHDVTIFQVNPNGDLLIRFEDIFLNPIQEAPLNTGFVTFSANPKSNLADGTVITNQAAIVFDSNEPFITNEVINTLYDDPSVTSSFSYEKQCASYGFDVNFNYTGGNTDVTYFWDFGTNAVPQTSTAEQPTGIQFAQGDHDVSLTVSKNGCSKTTTETLSITDIASVGTKKVTVCHNGQSITINNNALQAHLNHGDCVGMCQPINNKISGGIEADQTTNEHVVTYPNPVLNTLNVKINSITLYNGLQIIDLSGRIIFSQKLLENDLSIDTSNLKKGVYFISLKSESDKTLTKKFIKQ